MPEMKGKLETTYQWTCGQCSQENWQTDGVLLCDTCGEYRKDEKLLRHFKLTPEPIRLGFRT